MNFTKDEGGFMGKNSHMNKNDNGNSVAKEPTGSGNTYVQVVKWDVKTGGRETESIPVVFLDDECLMSNDFFMSLLGRVKEFASLANLKVALCNEGFVNIKIKYMGELWVLLEFVTRESIKLFRDNVSVGSWFSQIIEASRDFVTNGRIAWVEVEGEETCYHSKRLCIHTKSGRNILESFKIIHRGKAHWIRACETPGWVPDFADESDDEDQEDDMSNDGEKQADNNVEDGDVDDHENKSEDPFQIYKLLHKNNKVDRNEGVSDDSLKYPPGFTPYCSNDADSSNVVGDNNATVKVERVNTIYEANEGSGGIRVNGILKANSAESGMSGHFKTSSLPRTGGSILGILDEVVKVGQVMGYNMERCKSNMADIIRSQGVKEVNFLALQETKMESMDLLCVRMCWGNLAFEYAQSDSGVWRMTGQLVLLIVVYAPQEVSEKRLLWDICKVKYVKGMGLQLGGSVNLSHMFFADDAVFVGQWSEGNINSLVNILECFNMASGLKINMGNSKIMGVHVTRDKVDKAATKLGCLVLKAPFLYLGSMVGGAMSRSKSWCEVVDRVKKRLSKWKLKTLS
nr:nucleotide-binding alpha-beta plait domain-containing protein [Tanacetum cinerariifolium]